MGGNIAQRLSSADHDCIVYDRNAKNISAAVAGGAKGVDGMSALISMLQPPRAIWLMLPAAAVDGAIADLMPLLAPGDIIIDGGNSNYHDDIRRAKSLHVVSVYYVDVGVSGGVWGRDRGYCLMIGGDTSAVQHLDPIFRSLAPGLAAAGRTSGVSGDPAQAELGYLHCGPSGAGHFVKMIHNGIEYGIMASYAEGINILHNANIGASAQTPDAEKTPLREPEQYRYNFDIAAVAEVWRPHFRLRRRPADLASGHR
jgi:6-phosphogluconate dehydrogenase